MQQNFQTIKLPTTASQTTFTGGATWLNPTNILLNDGNNATIGLAGSGLPVYSVLALTLTSLPELSLMVLRYL